MARLEGVSESSASLVTRFVYWMARRRLGKVPQSLMVVSHHSWISRGYVGFELALDKSRLVDKRLKVLAEIKVATLIGCPY